MEFIASVLVGLVVVELYAWLPRISEWLLEAAVRRLRGENPERCREEWKAQLDSLPNTLVRVVHALSLTAAASQINADFCGDKLFELNQRLTHLLDLHRHNRKKLEDLKKMFEHNQETRRSSLGYAEQLLFESIRIPEVNSVVTKLQTSLAEYLAAWRAVVQKTDVIMEGMIERHALKIEEIGMVLSEASRAYDHTNYLFRRRITLSKSITVSIDALEGKVERLETDIKNEGECSNNDEPLAELHRIIGFVRRGGKKLAATVKTTPLRLPREARTEAGVEVQDNTDR